MKTLRMGHGDIASLTIIELSQESIFLLKKYIPKFVKIIEAFKTQFRRLPSTSYIQKIEKPLPYTTSFPVVEGELKNSSKPLIGIALFKQDTRLKLIGIKCIK